MITQIYCQACGKQMDCPLVCPACGALGTPAEDHYAALGFEKKLDLEAVLLRKRYIDLSRRLHPDRQRPGDEAARRRAEELTAELNKAYKILLNPESRAADWLAKRGVALREDKGFLDPILAERSLEIQEAIEISRGGEGEGGRGRESLRAMREEVERGLETSKKNLLELFRDSSSEDAPGLEMLKKALVRLRFIERQAHNLDEAMGGPSPLPKAAGVES